MKAFESVVETQYLMRHVKNPAFQWSAWGKYPRSGADWTAHENKLFITAINVFLSDQKGQKISKEHLVRLSTLHGRSVEGIKSHARSLLGIEQYRELIG